ncbi:MAG: hypothetical protein R3B57_02485 [Phycisphaerales bacterium]
MPKLSAIGALAAIALGAGAANADVVAQFQMHDHPDGDVNPPPYGLRVDNLFDAGRINTFSIDHFGDSIITINDDGGNLSIHMEGTLYGGRDGGEMPVTPEAYTYAFDFIEGVEAYNGGWRVVGTPDANGGFLDQVNGDFYATFGAKADDNGISFIFAPDGHRLPGDDSSWVGRGWVMADGVQRTGYTQDWLFTADVVPAPGTLALALGGGVLTMPRRRRK